MVLPGGMSMAGVTVGSLLSSRAVAADGAFQTSVETGGPGLAIVSGPGGKPLLFGLVREGKTDLSARTTAEVLAFIATGAPSFPVEIQKVYLEELSKPENLTNLERAVSDLIAAKGEAWMDSPNAAFKTALIQDTAHFRPTKTRGTVVTPTERTSGITVESSSNGSTTVTNYFRRRAYLYAQRESYLDENKTHHASFANLTPEAISISPVKGMNSLLPAIAEWLGGGVMPYEPVASDPISLSLTPADARSTRYTLMAVGVGSTEGDFAKLSPQQQADYLDLCIRTLILDFVIPIFTNIVISLRGERMDQWLQFVTGSGLLKDLINAYAMIPDLKAKIHAGQYRDASFDMIQAVIGTEAVKNILFKGFELFLKTFAVPDRAVFMNAALEKINGVLGAIDMFLQVADIVIQLLDLNQSQKATEWEVIVSKAKLQITPQEVIVPRSDVFPGIKVVAQDVTVPGGQAFEYAWKCGSGKLSDGTNYAQVIERTPQDSVLYDAVGLSAGTQDKIEVSVAIKGGPNIEPLGSTTVPVYVTEVTANPSSAKLKTKEQVTLSAEVQGLRALKPGEKITYKWLTTRNAGELMTSPDGGTTIPVETATATYKAHETKEGVDTVTLEAFLGSTKLGKTTVKVTVGANTITVPGRWYVETKAAGEGRTSVRALLMVPKIEDAKSYSVYCHDFNDTAYYGTEYRRSWTMPGLPSDWGDWGTEYAFGLAGGTGPSEGAAASVAYYQGRFAGMVVDVTVTL